MAAVPVEAALAEFARLHAGGTKQCWNRGLPTLTALAPMGDLRALAARTPDGAVVGCAIYKAAAVPTVAIGSAQPAATLLDLAGVDRPAAYEGRSLAPLLVATKRIQDAFVHQAVIPQVIVVVR